MQLAKVESAPQRNDWKDNPIRSFVRKIPAGCVACSNGRGQNHDWLVHGNPGRRTEHRAPSRPTAPMSDKTSKKQGYVDNEIAERESVPERGADFGDGFCGFLRAHAHAKLVVERRNGLRVDEIEHQDPARTLYGPKSSPVLSDVAHRITKFLESIDIGFVWRTQDNPLAPRARYDPRGKYV